MQSEFRNNVDSPKKIIRSTQDSVMLRTNLFAKAFKLGDRTGSRNDSTPALLRISRNCQVRSVDRSWIKNRLSRKKPSQARDLQRSGFAGLRNNSSNVDFPCHQTHHEEHVMPHQSDRRPYFDGEESRCCHPAPMNSEKFLPAQSLAPVWRWIQTGLAQNFGDLAAPDLVSQIGQRTLDARVTP
jgi:hypothetical protein